MKLMSTTKLDADDKNRLAVAGLSLFLSLSKRWDLDIASQLILLGSPARGTFYGWKKALNSGGTIPLSNDTLERLSLIAGIRKGVELLYSEHRWDEYMKAPNNYFGNQTPLEKMLNGSISDLVDVRRYLDSSRGCHFA